MQKEFFFVNQDRPAHTIEKEKLQSYAASLLKQLNEFLSQNGIEKEAVLIDKVVNTD